MTSSLSDTDLGLLERTRSEQAYGHEEKSRGAVPTRQEVVDFMLDLIGYTTDKPLHTQRLLEPSFGDCRFVLSAVECLILARRDQGGSDHRDLLDCNRAVELDEATFKTFRQVLEAKVVERGFEGAAAHELAEAWGVHAEHVSQQTLFSVPTKVQRRQIDLELRFANLEQESHFRNRDE